MSVSEYIHKGYATFKILYQRILAFVFPSVCVFACGTNSLVFHQFT